MYKQIVIYSNPFHQCSSLYRLNVCFKIVTRKSSTLYINNFDSTQTPVVEVDLDLINMTEKVSFIQKDLERRNLKFDIDGLLRSIQRYQDLHKEKSRLEKEREHVSNIMKVIVKEKKSLEIEDEKRSLIKKGKEIKSSLKGLYDNYYAVEEEVMQSALKLPVSLYEKTLDKDVDLEAIKEIPPKEYTPKSHMDIANSMNFIKEGQIGQSSNYLIGSLSMLERNILHKSHKLLKENQFHLISGSHLVRHPIVEATGRELGNKHYAFHLHSRKEESEAGLEVPLCCDGNGLSIFTSFLTRMTINSSELPLRLASIGPAYQPHLWKNDLSQNLLSTPQVHTADLYGAHSTMEGSELLLDEFYNLMKVFYKWSGVPVRIIQKGARSLRNSEAYRIDFNVLIPSTQEFHTCGSLSLHKDYLSRRLMMFHSTRPNQALNKSGFQYSVYGRCVNVSVLMASVLENSQAAERTKTNS